MELKQKVEKLIADVDATHRYSISRIYGLYNEAFGTNEQPQSCASCLIRKTNQLREWLSVYAENKKVSEATSADLTSKKRKSKSLA